MLNGRCCQQIGVQKEGDKMLKCFQESQACGVEGLIICWSLQPKKQVEERISRRSVGRGREDSPGGKKMRYKAHPEESCIFVKFEGEIRPTTW